MASGTAHTTSPWSWYSDPQTLPLEQERIFRRGWQYVGPVEHAAQPGEFFTSRIGDVPVLVARGRDERLRAFLNVCRHRGAVLVEGRGRRETLQCHYHAWTYDLDGTLRSAPRADREPTFDKDELSLVPASVDTWGPFVFVNPDPDAAPLVEHLGGLPTILAQVIDVDAIVFHSRVEFGSNANWKIVVENFLECYHCPTAHPAFSAEVDVHPDRYRLESHPTFGAQYARAKATGDGGQFHLLYPNTGINVFPGPANLSIGPISPDGVHRTHRYLDYFFAPGVDEAWLAEFFAFDDQVGREDTALVESVHRGMASGLLDRGRLLVEAEPLLVAFQRWLARQLEPVRA